MFIDEIQIYVKAGKGGDGAVSFRREKYIPKGGPDGGDGGNGGDVVFRSVETTHGLSHLSNQLKYLAEDGENGRGKNKHGKNGKDLTVDVPIGTIIYEGEEEIIEFKKLDQTEIIAKGGRGGWGNQHFATSIKQTPMWSKGGLRGEGRKLKLVLKTIADVGLVGFPNAGKSSFLATVSGARPKIADYPFTTLEPNLGTIIHKERRFIVADIPGLIEGASKGRGLGDKFLKHIERTRILLFVLDITSPTLAKDFKVLQKELKEFSPTLLKKRSIIALNKIDLVMQYADIIKDMKLKVPIYPISTATKEGIDKLLDKIIEKT